ncbi:hypothetical protein HanIR_Chr14g0689061 [Helianthus annuus]|nr:hypothetical protein HanIR_Chr14g0689061 [Helianthus annuus]
MASQRKSVSTAMPTITSSQSSMSLRPIPSHIQKNSETAQKKTSSVFQGSKTSTTSSSINNDISVLYSQMKSYVKQQNKTNQKILREIEDIKKQKRPVEDQSPLMRRVLDFVTLTSTTQQSKGSSFQLQGSFILQQGSLRMTQTQGSSLRSEGYVEMFQP